MACLGRPGQSRCYVLQPSAARYVHCAWFQSYAPGSFFFLPEKDGLLDIFAVVRASFLAFQTAMVSFGAPEANMF